MDKALQTMIDNMPEKTGKSLDEWKVILREKSFTKHSEGVKFLKSEHGVTHGFANTIVSLSKEEDCYYRIQVYQLCWLKVYHTKIVIFWILSL